jgi:hypothetical protein
MLVSSFIIPSSIVSDHVHADPANWTWADYQRKHFEKNPVWQQFADKWRNNEDLNREDASGITLDNLALPASGDDSLMIRNCYVEAENFVWKIARSSPRTGVIIAGQPGIGMIISCISVRLRRDIYRENAFHMVLTYQTPKVGTSYQLSYSMYLVQMYFSTMTVFTLPQQTQTTITSPPPAPVPSFGYYLTLVRRRWFQHVCFIPNVSLCKFHHPIRVFIIGGSSEALSTPCSRYGLSMSSITRKRLFDRFPISQAFSMQRTGFSRI